MQTSLDRFGRAVIPKEVRDRLGLTPGIVPHVSEPGEGGCYLAVRPLQCEGIVVSPVRGGRQ